MARANAEPPDAVLVVAAILGDLEAFDELASRYRAAVVRAAQAVVGREDAEDVAQDALLLAFKALPSIEEPQKFAAWLAAITRHRALRFSRRERETARRRVEMDELLLERVSALARPLLDEMRVGEDLRRALERLPADYALALQLRFFDDMPLKRIAAFLGVSVATVKWRVHRGKQLLREQLEQFDAKEKSWKGTRRSASS